MLMRMSEWRETGLDEKAASAKMLFEGGDDFKPSRKDELVQKASALAAQDPAGAGSEPLLWVKATTGNAFLPWLRVYEAGKVNQVRLPQLESEPALDKPTAIDGGIVGATGAITDDADVIDIDLEYYHSNMRATHSALEDLPGFEDSYAALVIEQVFKQSGDKVFADIKASTNVASVNTGAAAALPTAANVADKLGELIEQVPGQYHGQAALHVSPQMWRRLSASPNSDISTDWGPAWQGIPLVVNGALEAGNAAGHVSAIFGDLWYGYLLAIRSDLIIQVYHDKGVPWLHSRVRFGGAVWDSAALGVMRTGA